MKKTLIILAIVIMILCLNKQEAIRIPKEAIRFRVIANSDLEEDQKMKKEIVKNLSFELKNIKNMNSLEETRKYIVEKLPTFETIVKNSLEENNADPSFSIHYGQNYFPEKIYKDVIYEEGEYESLVVTLGSGNGENFWCVLFPPVCFLDENEDIEYKSFIKEMIEKYF